MIQRGGCGAGGRYHLQVKVVVQRAGARAAPSPLMSMMRGVGERDVYRRSTFERRLLLGDDMIALTSQGVLVRIDTKGAQSVLLSGHFSPTPTTQLRACATLSDNRVATAGMDRLLCVGRRVEAAGELHAPVATGAVVDCSEDKIAAGLDDGSVVVVDASTMKTLFIIKGGAHTKNEIEKEGTTASARAASWPRRVRASSTRL